MQTVLVTGGAGFIGSNFIEMLLEERPDMRIVCVDAMTYAANPHTLDAVLPRITFYRADICDADAIDDIFAKEQPDCVVHFAAETHVDRSITDPQVFVQTNVLGTSVLLEACRRFGGVRFHQVGTDEVYGELPTDRPDLLFREDTPLHASSPYSASKASADLLALAYARTFSLPVTVSRCSNNYGPYQFPEKLIPLMIFNAMRGRLLPVYGDGLQVRDWLYVRDHCLGILAVLEKGRTGEVYNLGGNNERTNLEIVRLILHTLGKPESLIAHVEDRKGHDRRYAIDAGKAKRELGWMPQTAFDEGIRTTIDWYAGHARWLEECRPDCK